MRWPFIFILIVSLCFGISLSVHAEPVAGDSCAGYPEGAQMYSGGPGMGGHAFQITCQSGVWALLQVNPGSGGGDGGGGQDDTPDLFTFTSLNDQSLSTQVFSNSVTITGIGPDPVNVTVSGDGGPTMRINGTGGWVTSGTIANNQTLELRMTTSILPGTLNSATVVVGTRTRYWKVTTKHTCQTGPIGTECDGGAIYAGDLSGRRLYVTADAYEISNAYWGMYNLPANADSSTDGRTNTVNAYNAIQQNLRTSGGCSGNYNPPACSPNAIVYCHELVAHGHDDWYLPAHSELAVLRTNASQIGMSDNTEQWTSTETAPMRAVYLSHFNGYTYHKRDRGYVRCIRD